MSQRDSRPENIVALMIELRDFHLVGRSTREIARFLGMSEADVESTLTASPAMIRRESRLWGFANGQDPDFTAYIKYPAKTKAKPMPTKKAVKPSKEPAEEPRLAMPAEDAIDDLF